MASEPLIVSFVAGIVVARDAISNIVREHMAALIGHGQRTKQRIDIRTFTQHTDIPDPRIQVVTDVSSLLSNDHFQRSDLIIYHFGIYYGLFDSILLAPRTAKVVVFYQGVTHPRLVAPTDRDVIYRSFEQATNILCADQVLTASYHLHRELIGMGVRPERLGLNRFAALEEGAKPLRRLWSKDRLRLIYLGRFNPAKGVHELLTALSLFQQQHAIPVELALVGSRRFTPPGYLDRLNQLIEQDKLKGVRFYFDVTNDELNRHLMEADLLVMPSHHEGFCVPVIEALSRGCYVICTDAGALPETSGGLGLSFPAGNTHVLVDKLAKFVEIWQTGQVPTSQGVTSLDEWYHRRDEHLARYTRETSEQSFLDQVLQGVQPMGEGRERLVMHNKAVLQQLCNVPTRPSPQRDLKRISSRRSDQRISLRVRFGKYAQSNRGG